MCRHDLPKQEKYLQEAMRAYMNLLEIDESNCAGVLGIANVLVEHNKVAEAKEVFKPLEQSEPDSALG